ncbi:hypothetical protein O6H91_13G087400 [Diphasiastrum complanatum]|uniref:Uncharacterized protein n=2 Tax=Diphasiastrum complanatum TaxID=34168 RepID=A0ACC2BXD5_DIPCM|nr:hypothetical protein O6H91_13G087400 [Diphasiastrum complanatum]KAJ7534278.1 hypothetical protein O6H91_13G087400 [Diphasiastrum complanatum]
MALPRSFLCKHACRVLRSAWTHETTRIPPPSPRCSQILPCLPMRRMTTTHTGNEPSEKVEKDRVAGIIYENADFEARRRFLNRILYRSRQRGFLELDLLLGKWAEDNIQDLHDEQLEALVEVLDVENPDLWKWLTGQEGAPESLTSNIVFQAIKKQVSDNLCMHSSPDTRATPGQPWVRGWDDFRKIGGPQIGNQ